MRFLADVNYVCTLDTIDEYESSYDDELIIVLTQGFDHLVFNSVLYHVNNDVIDAIGYMLQLQVIDKSKNLELPKIMYSC